MTGNPYQDRIAERILAADPVELVTILLEQLTCAIRDARHALASAQPAQRARAISRAMEITGELAHSLNPSADPLLATRLAQLYDFVLDQLHSAHSLQSDQPLANAERVAQTLLEAWHAIGATRLDAQPSPLPCSNPAVSLAG